MTPLCTTPVAVVGIGNMGLGMALRLRDAGQAVRVHDIDPARHALAATAGAVPAASPAEAAAGCAVLIVAVVDAAQTEAVLFGPQGAAAALPAGATVLLCPTIGPQDVERFAARLQQVGGRRVVQQRARPRAAPATLRLLREGPLPMVAALTGAAVGAGLELALCSDLRVAHPEVVMQMPPVKLGIVYTLEGIWRLAALCGAARARELLLLAEPISAETGQKLGLVSRLVPAEQVLDTACALAQKVAAQPRPAVLGTRHLLEHLLRTGPTQTDTQEEELLALRLQSWQSPEATAARQRLRQRRKSSDRS